MEINMADWYDLGATITIYTVIFYVLISWLALVVRFASGYCVVLDDDEESNTSFLLHRNIHDISGMIVITIATTILSSVVSLLWIVIVPVAIITAIAFYFHRKNRPVVQAMEELSGERQ